MTPSEIQAELESLEPLREAQRSWAMKYQPDLKVEVAKHLGVTFEEVDLPYEEWAAVRNHYLASGQEEKLECH